MDIIIVCSLKIGEWASIEPAYEDEVEDLWYVFIEQQKNPLDGLTHYPSGVGLFRGGQEIELSLFGKLVWREETFVAIISWL